MKPRWQRALDWAAMTKVEPLKEYIRELEGRLASEMNQLANAAKHIQELEAELADLRTYRDLHYCGEKGIVERATAELKARVAEAREREAE